MSLQFLYQARMSSDSRSETERRFPRPLISSQTQTAHITALYVCVCLCKCALLPLINVWLQITIITLIDISWPSPVDEVAQLVADGL